MVLCTIIRDDGTIISHYYQDDYYLHLNDYGTIIYYE